MRMREGSSLLLVELAVRKKFVFAEGGHQGEQNK